MIAVILHGFILALGLILPLGVQNVFVFNQGVVQPRFIRALPVMITASLCDTLLISLAVLGVSVIVLEYEWIKLTLFTLGICFLVYMGAATWRSKPSGQDPESARSFSPKKQIVFAMSVSLLNPHAVLDTMGVIGTSSLQYEGADKIDFYRCMHRRLLAVVPGTWHCRSGDGKDGFDRQAAVRAEPNIGGDYVGYGRLSRASIGSNLVRRNLDGTENLC